MRLLVLATYRDTDLDRTHPLADVLADLRRQPGVDRLDLEGLDEAEVMALMETAAGHDLDEPGLALARALHSETEGNPFFVGEVLRHLAESGAIVQRDGRWTSDTTLEEVGIPEGIREVVGRRLSRLPTHANRGARDRRGDRRDSSTSSTIEGRGRTRRRRAVRRARRGHAALASSARCPARSAATRSRTRSCVRRSTRS